MHSTKGALCSCCPGFVRSQRLQMAFEEIQGWLGSDEGRKFGPESRKAYEKPLLTKDEQVNLDEWWKMNEVPGGKG